MQKIESFVKHKIALFFYICHQEVNKIIEEQNMYEKDLDENEKKLTFIICEFLIYKSLSFFSQL